MTRPGFRNGLQPDASRDILRTRHRFCNRESRDQLPEADGDVSRSGGVVGESGGPSGETAVERRARNAALDDAIRRLIAQVPSRMLGSRPEGGGWTLAENLAHLAEFPLFFADEIGRQMRDDRPTVGRTHDHVARQEAISRAGERNLEELRSDVGAALEGLDDVLEDLRDEHMLKLGENRKYGLEPLSMFLDRYVLDHKAAHILQLEEALRSLGAVP